MPEEGYIYFPEGEYGLDINIPPINITRSVVINGSGTHGTTLKLHKSFHVQNSHVTFENLTIQRFSTFVLTGAIAVFAPYFSMRNVSIQNQAAPNSPAIYLDNSASNWYLENVEMQSFSIGLKNEASFGTGINLSVFDGLIGIEDDCSEGSTYTACRTFNNQNMGIQCLQRGLFSGCFATDPVEIKDKTLWVGGNLDYKQLSNATSGTIFTKNAFKQFHHKAESSHFAKNDNDEDQISFYAGGTTDGVFEFPSSSDGSGQRWKLKYGSNDIQANPEDVVYELGLPGAGLSALLFSAGNPEHIYTNKGTETYMTPGKLGFPRGYYIGENNGFIYVTSDVTKPNGSWGRRGDRVMNRTPVVKVTNQVPSDANFMGWICIQSAVNGSGAIWRGFGLLKE